MGYRSCASSSSTSWQGLYTASEQERGEMAEWSPSLYMKFGDQRTRPAVDLLARVPAAEPRRVADLGCGPGNSTELLAARWPTAEIVGIDNSHDMLEQARRLHPAWR